MTTLELDDDYKAELLKGWLDAAKPEFQTEEELKSFLECKCFEVVDIAYLAVQKEYRNMGYGREIMSFVFDYARKAHPNCLFMTVDALYLKDIDYDATGFYAKFGFQRMLPVVSDTLRMFCTLYKKP